MTSALVRPAAPRTSLGPAALVEALRPQRQPALALIDARLRGPREQMERSGHRVLLVDAGALDAAAVLDRVRASDPQPETAIVGIGGGTVMDAAKLTRLALDDPQASRAGLDRAERLGTALLPDTVRMRRALILQPSTLGTGSEFSAVACHSVEGARRLLSGQAMRADAVALDPALTRGLDAATVAEGIIEMLLRLIGSAISSDPSAEPDRASAELLVRIATAAAAERRHPGDPATRAALLLASGEMHTGWAGVGRSPYGVTHWYLANELAAVTGARKVPATLHVLPELWSRILAGDERLGHARRLRHFWGCVAGPLGLSADPVRAAQSWAAHAGIAPLSPSPEETTLAAARCRALGGGRHPAFRGFSTAELADLLTPHTSRPPRGGTHQQPQKGGDTP